MKLLLNAEIPKHVPQKKMENFVFCFSVVPPGVPVITGPEIFLAGDSVTLICTVTGGDPTPTVKWFHNSNVIDDSSSVNGSVVTNTYSFQATVDQHLTDFECHSENGVLGRPLIRTIVVEVYS